MDYRAIARAQLLAAHVDTALTEKLRPELAAVLDELRQLSDDAQRLSQRIEHVWNGPIRTVTRSHDRLLKAMFPKGVPADCYVVASEMSGLVTSVEVFHDIVVLLHNTPDRYLRQTHMADLVGAIGPRPSASRPGRR